VVDYLGQHVTTGCKIVHFGDYISGLFAHT
jgi:hypothetical protein